MEHWLNRRRHFSILDTVFPNNLKSANSSLSTKRTPRMIKKSNITNLQCGLKEVKWEGLIWFSIASFMSIERLKSMAPVGFNNHHRGIVLRPESIVGG